MHVATSTSLVCIEYRRAGGEAARSQPTAALSQNLIRPNSLPLRSTYYYKMITIDNKLFSPTIKTRYEVL